MKKFKIVAIDDQPQNIEHTIKLIIESKPELFEAGGCISTEAEFCQMMSINKIKRADILLVDYYLKNPRWDKNKEANGVEIIKKIKDEFNIDNPDIILFSGELNDHDKINEFMNLFEHYNLHSYVKRDSFLALLFHCINIANKKKLKLQLEEGYRKRVIDDTLIGDTPVINKVKDLIKLVAPHDVPVLIIGESGVGKELVAHSIHKTSRRQNYDYVKVNCAAFTESLLQAELFGYEPGSFTGALAKGKKGLLETANKGTIFLDEIGDASKGFQKSLLRAIESKEIVRVGGIETRKIDVRIISATNQSLKENIKAGSFRNDLYQRLCTFIINVPPLRDRIDDIENITADYLKEYKGICINPDAMDILKNYFFPGNVRELLTLLERATIFLNSNSEITVDEIKKAFELEEDDKAKTLSHTIEKDKMLPALTKLLCSENHNDWAEYFKIVKHFPSKNQKVVKKELTGLEDVELNEREKHILTTLKNQLNNVTKLAKFIGRNNTKQVYEMFNKLGIK